MRRKAMILAVILLALLSGQRAAVAEIDWTGLYGALTPTVYTRPDASVPVTVSFPFSDKGPALTVDIEYADHLFTEDTTRQELSVRRLQLASVSSALSAAAYNWEDVKNALEALSFQDVWQVDYRAATEFDNDFAAVTFARKTIAFAEGRMEVFAAVIRGTDGFEWLSNFNIGTDDTHLGFHTAARKVMDAFYAYYSALMENGLIDADIGNNVVWITGHSRGAAVANIIAGQLCDSEDYCLKACLHAYTFACPAVARLTQGYITVYRSILNFNNPADFVTCVPLKSWGFQRYGVTVDVSKRGSDAVRMAQVFREITGMAYKGATNAENEDLMTRIGVMVPSNSDYYKERSSIHSLSELGFDEKRYVPADVFRNIALYLAGADGFSAGQALDSLKSADVMDILKHFVTPHPMAKIVHAHCTASYIAWLAALSAAGPAAVPEATPPAVYSLDWYNTLLNMDMASALHYLGPDYHDGSAGAEGALEGYEYPALNITLIYDYDDEFLLDSVYCWDGASVGPVALGMTFAQIQAILGPPEKFWPENDEELNYINTIDYRFGQMHISFVTYDVNIPTFEAVLYISRPI